MRRRTSDTGDFCSRKRLIVRLRSSCSSLNERFMSLLQHLSLARHPELPSVEVGAYLPFLQPFEVAHAADSTVQASFAWRRPFAQRTALRSEYQQSCSLEQR